MDPRSKVVALLLLSLSQTFGAPVDTSQLPTAGTVGRAAGTLGPFDVGTVGTVGTVPGNPNPLPTPPEFPYEPWMKVGWPPGSDGAANAAAVVAAGSGSSGTTGSTTSATPAAATASGSGSNSGSSGNGASNNAPAPSGQSPPAPASNNANANGNANGNTPSSNKANEPSLNDKKTPKQPVEVDDGNDQSESARRIGGIVGGIVGATAMASLLAVLVLAHRRNKQTKEIQPPVASIGSERALADGMGMPILTGDQTSDQVFSPVTNTSDQVYAREVSTKMDEFNIPIPQNDHELDTNGDEIEGQRDGSDMSSPVVPDSTGLKNVNELSIDTSMLGVAAATVAANGVRARSRSVDARRQVAVTPSSITDAPLSADYGHTDDEGAEEDMDEDTADNTRQNRFKRWSMSLRALGDSVQNAGGALKDKTEMKIDEAEADVLERVPAVSELEAVPAQRGINQLNESANDKDLPSAPEKSEGRFLQWSRGLLGGAVASRLLKSNQPSPLVQDTLPEYDSHSSGGGSNGSNSRDPISDNVVVNEPPRSATEDDDVMVDEEMFEEQVPAQLESKQSRFKRWSRSVLQSGDPAALASQLTRQRSMDKIARRDLNEDQVSINGTLSQLDNVSIMSSSTLSQVFGASEGPAQ